MKSLKRYLAFILAIMVIIQPFAMIDASAATYGSVTSKTSYSIPGCKSPCSKFQIKTNSYGNKMAFCGQHNQYPPSKGDKITAITKVSKVNIRKALYYGYGGPKAKLSKTTANFIKTSMALSRANGNVGSGNSTYDSWYKKLDDYDTPPDYFIVYKCEVAGPNQDIFFWEYNPDGKVKITKKSTDTEVLDVYSVKGAVYGVYTDKSCTKRKTKMTIGSNGTASVTLEEGTYYIKEITAPAGFKIDKTVHKAVVEADKTTSITSKETPKKCELTLEKSSSCEEITNNNPAYTLAGAEYTVYKDKKCKKVVDVFKVDADGKTNTIEVYAGTYYILETKAPDKGFLKDETLHNITVSLKDVDAGKVKVVKVTDDPVDDPVYLLLQKEDEETETASAQGGASLAGAQYIFKFYFGTEYTEDPALEGAEPERTWVFETNEKGRIEFIESYLASGYDQSEFWYDANNYPTLPVGTLTIQEIKAPSGYIINDELFLRVIDETPGTEGVSTYNVPISREPIIRGDIEIYKTDSKTGKALSGVSFDVISKTTGETVTTLTTDSNGYATTYDEKNPDGSLVYDTYILRETEYPIGYYPLDDIEVDVKKAHKTVTVELKNDYPLIGTTATDSETGNHISYADNSVKIIDKVSYENLIEGEEYVLKGILMDKTTGEPLYIDGESVISEVKFTPETKNGTQEVEFTFDATGLEGASITVFETLLKENVEIIKHENLEDEEQTIIFPKLSTTAKDSATSTHSAAPKENVTIKDSVKYENLIEGEEYTLKGILMDKATGEPLLINGEQITSEKTFTPEETSGKVVMEFTFNATGLEGLSTVVYEELYCNSELIGQHKNLEDEGQTVSFPNLGTTATFKDTGTDEAYTQRRTVVIDKVEYKNLVPGQEYVLKGVLMDKATEKPFIDKNGDKITSEVEFTPDKANGTVEVKFTFNSYMMEKAELVVYEELYCNSELIGQHKNLEDEGQTVRVYPKGTVTITTDDDNRFIKGVKAVMTSDAFPLFAVVGIMIIAGISAIIIIRRRKEEM